MKQILAVITTVAIYLGSVLLIDTAIAMDHHEGAQDAPKAHEHKDGDRMRGHEKMRRHEGKDQRRDHSPVRMLFRGLDLNEEQRVQVGSIMREQKEKGRNQQESFKSETRDRLAGVLTEEQLGQLDQNAKRMKDMKSKMDRKKGGPKGKGSKHKKKGKHKPRPQHN
jgi:hypothetical protein|tara:strand:+ start:2192 stop:2689 length:498 start_codon:yes stop_codon:yes gene_type:complete